MIKALVILFFFSLRAAFAGEIIKIPLSTFTAGNKYGEVLPKTFTVTVNKKGGYRLSAEVHTSTDAFSEAQIEVFQTLLCAQGDKIRLNSSPQIVDVIFQNTKSEAQKYIIKMTSYTAGQNVYWKNIKLEYLEKTPAQISVFDLWRNFRNGSHVDKNLETWKLEDFTYPQVTLPSSPTIPGEPTIGRATLKSIGFHWPIAKDYNRNGQVKVQFRREGDKEWRLGQDMLRMMFESTGFSRLSWSYITPNQYAGSILGLESGTTYEIKLSLHDPDSGSCEKILSASTRKTLSAGKSERIIDVYPGDLRNAYARAIPGDTLLLHPGEYSFLSKHNPNRYTNTRKYIFPPCQDKDRRIYEDLSVAIEDSALTFDKAGTIDKPITIRGTDKNEVIIDGGASAILVNFTNAQYHCFENMTLQNAEYIFFSNNTLGISINNCVIRDCRYGVVAGSGDLKKLYTQSPDSVARVYDVDIFNNYIIGNWSDIEWSLGWSRYTKEIGYQKLRFNSGIMLGGQGHAVHNNYIAQFWDGFGVYFIVSPQKDPAYHNSNIDLYNNYISCCPDDCVEVDFSVNNVRVFKNFISNSHMGISCQPVCGGPAYIYKNVIFNSRMFAFKFSRNPSGVLVYNNTCIVARGGRFAPEWQNSKILNNLFIGNQVSDSEFQPSGIITPPYAPPTNSPQTPTGPLWTGIATPYTSELNYNGYSKCGSGNVLWTYARANAPVMAKGYTIFKDIKDFSRNTKWEKNAVIDIKTDELRQYIKPAFKYVDANRLDPRPTSNASFIDSAKLLHNINDDFSGSAPAIGAYDSAEKLYDYGPQAGETQ